MKYYAKLYYKGEFVETITGTKKQVIKARAEWIKRGNDVMWAICNERPVHDLYGASYVYKIGDEPFLLHFD